MITIISPSKSVTTRPAPYTIPSSSILFPEIHSNILNSLKKLSKKQLQHTLQTSKNLTQLNYERYRTWDNTVKKPALWLYSGDVYNGFNAFTLNENDSQYIQKHLLIVSGLYGLIRPFDEIRPYRLEMKLAFSGLWGKNLYHAWQQPIAEYISKLPDKTILICASNEYSKAVTGKLPDDVHIIVPRFMQKTDTGLKEKALFAKYFRGVLARWVIDNKVSVAHDLTAFKEEGSYISKAHTSDKELVFIIPNNFSLKGRFTKQ